MLASTGGQCVALTKHNKRIESPPPPNSLDSLETCKTSLQLTLYNPLSRNID